MRSAHDKAKNITNAAKHGRNKATNTPQGAGARDSCADRAEGRGHKGLLPERIGIGNPYRDRITLPHYCCRRDRSRLGNCYKRTH